MFSLISTSKKKFILMFPMLIMSLSMGKRENFRCTQANKPPRHYPEKTGAEFPFTRYFYEYKEPEKADVLLKCFMELEKATSAKVKELGE